MSNLALWNWVSPVWLVAAAILAAYFVCFRGTARKQIVLLFGGLALLVLAFVSPIGVLAAGYLFSAHMVQHLLLLLVIPLLFLLSLPSDRVSPWFDRPVLDRLGQWLAIPVVGWVCGVGAMWLWHLPSLCSVSTQSALLGGLRDSSFVTAGLMFWWPIYAPVGRYRVQPLSGIAYLFSACLGCTLLGIYITFTTITVCPAFANPVDRLGILSRLYDAGLTPGVDQHLGGLLMWVPPCMLYVSASISLLCRWYAVMDEPGLLPRVSTRARART
jgi:cytochrome c oxidase assembly factor CtaG